MLVSIVSGCFFGIIPQGSILKRFLSGIGVRRINCIVFNEGVTGGNKDSYNDKDSFTTKANYKPEVLHDNTTLQMFVNGCLKQNIYFLILRFISQLLCECICKLSINLENQFK